MLGFIPVSFQPSPGNGEGTGHVIVFDSAVSLPGTGGRSMERIPKLEIRAPSPRENPPVLGRCGVPIFDPSPTEGLSFLEFFLDTTKRPTWGEALVSEVLKCLSEGMQGTLGTIDSYGPAQLVFMNVEPRRPPNCLGME